MSSTSTDDRVALLKRQAEDASQGNELAKAAQLLREASKLAPNDEEIQKQWRSLQDREGGADVLQLLNAYIESKKDDEGQHVLLALGQQKQMNPDAASSIYQLLQKNEPNLALHDRITGTWLTAHAEAKNLVVKDLASSTTDTFDRFFSYGPESFHAFSSLPFENNLWTSKEPQTTAQKDLFRLCVATLMDTAIDHPDRLMQALARQLALSPENVVSLIDADVSDVILSSLDIRLDSSLRRQATLATAKMLEATKEHGEVLFANFVTEHVAKQRNDDLIVAFSAAAEVFPIIPLVASRLFMTDGFVQQLVPNLEKNSDAAASGKRKSTTLEQAALELLSAACVEKSCREAINRYCANWLKNLSDDSKNAHNALASLILAKINATSESDITKKLSALVLQGDDEIQQAIEGLAYTSLQPKIKEDIINDTPLVKRLINALETKPAVTFGCLTIFANLSTYRIKQSEEQKKMAQLQAYANHIKLEPDDPLDNDGFVTPRCKVLCDNGIVSALLACCRQTTSPTNVALVVRILLMLSKEQKHRAKMAQQGAVRLLLQIRDRIAKADKSTSEASLIERNAAHAIARLLISINPSHVFSASLPASSAVSALVPLLSPDQESGQTDRLPTFEALLALTNLASMEDNSVRDLQLRLAWEKIEDLLFSPTMLVQRATVELVCNLMASPSCVAKFADGSADAKRRITILLALADVDDLATRRASGGALAMLTEWDAAVTAVLDSKDSRGIKVLLSMCQDDSEEMRHRALACLANIIGAPGDVGKRGVAQLKAEKGQEAIKEALKGSRDATILALGVEVLKQLV
ncbi:ring assembly protein 3 [Acrodontium crateriforme]|uniref:Ring assembly protein 3 n=1 Tax=Acrodontium crateriforme TaxID=150365 RepID=A0AAQ3MBZ1_9PEZI|nr:ring assembly protein 3 [Acrodontium crateriforme]